MTKKALILAVLVYWSSFATAQNLVEVTYLGSKTKTELLAQFNNLPLIQYGAKYYRVAYTSLDVHGVTDTVTGLLVAPDDDNRIYPRLVYQHGTSGTKQDVPSINYSNGEGQVGLLFAGLGYVAFLPDYLGLGNISKGFHPYVHAETEATVAMNMLRACNSFLEEQQIKVQSQLFVTGYSQGGHAAMALHRAAELDPEHEFAITAAAHLSGPYSISGVMRDLILSDDIYYFPGYLPNTTLSYQTVYGNLFTDVSEVFRTPYDEMVMDFYEGNITLSALNAALIDTLIAREGASRPFRMLQPNMVQEIMNDPQHPINVALAANDTYTNWQPQAPMRIFYCMADDQVPFRNSVVATDTLMAAGAANLQSQDVLPTGDHGDCYVPAMTSTIFFFYQFQNVGIVGAEEPAIQIQPQTIPNPASSRVIVRGLPLKGRMEIYAADGKRMLEIQTNSATTTLDVSKWPNGTYYLKVSTANSSGYSLMVIQH